MIPLGAGQFFHATSAITKHQPLLAAMKPGNDQGGVFQAADEIESDLRCLVGAERRRHNLPFASAMPGGPSQQAVRIAHGCRQADSLKLPTCEVSDSFENGEQMPAAVAASEGMDLINDHGARRREHLPPERIDRDEHSLQRLRRGEENVGRCVTDVVFPTAGDVSVPHLATASQERCVMAEALLKVVQERLERADINDTERAPFLVDHPRENRKHGSLGLAAGGGREEQAMVTVEDRADALLLQRPQRPPPERIDDVVLNERIQAIEGAHTSREMSSTDRPR